MASIRYSKKELKVVICAIAYEIYNESLITDAEYDRLAIEVAETMRDKVPGYDECTGMWVRNAITPSLLALTQSCIRGAEIYERTS